jgi:hypothetical protein
VSKDGVVYLANDWFPSLVADRPVEVVTLLGVEFHQFSLPKAPVAAVEPPQEAPEVPVGVTGFAGLPLDLTQDRKVASGAPEASDEDADEASDEWRVPHPGDVGSIIQVRDADSGWRWTDRKLLAIIPEDLDNPNRGSFVCATKDGDETTICFTWKFARIAKQKPAWEPQPGGCVRVTEASDEDADEWRVPDVDDIGKLVEVRDREDPSAGWHTRRLLAVLWECDKGRGVFVAKSDSSSGCYRWKHARISNKQQPEAPKPETFQEIQPGTKVKILHPDCLGRTGTTSWENCPFPNCLFVWVDSEDPVLKVGAIPILKRYLAPLS